jgi:hypothetical protein
LTPTAILKIVPLGRASIKHVETVLFAVASALVFEKVPQQFSTDAVAPFALE